MLLSYLLEKIYHKKYADILQTKIIKPLKLKHAQFGDKSVPEHKKTYSYTYEKQWVKVPMTDESIPMGAGGIVISANDLSIFINKLFEGQIISSASLDIILTQKDGFGMGIFKTAVAGNETYTHIGRIDEFNSFFYYFPEQKLTYILLSNVADYDLARINNIVLKTVFNTALEEKR